MRAALRPWSAVPRRLCWLLAASLLLQLGWRLAQQQAPARARPLPAAPPAAVARLASLGEPLAMSKAMLLYLQSFEDQPGVSLRWRELDYERLAGWLDTAQTLDPRSRYALVAASEVYAGVADPARARRMLAFVAASFAADPGRRWPAMAQAVLLARHQLHDLPLALTYARALRRLATGPQVPPWAREMEAFILEDMDQLDSARLVIGGLIQSGQISDPHELAFLARRLDELASQIAAKKANAPP
ncbi:hypothetical protein GQ37_000720 [Janthinobacterium sp. BJB1]|uniref:hypothetical protein n=1 Tax=Janthinobacterium sp. GW458P TaxID=1981504 RepID=UPI000C0C746C|nr:hypothetical protein [Janthinobacterium sp. GW458P]MBE3025768.1 hypothetical protein [Janthinobacterium sp. GW458P]PHV13616.1 hypothetical protein CSQ90_27720 [Janthinobacterium sp. BJB303]PJD00187.1 hypothetical protein GQ37_000720 [Janthinobacterium sp. BJB1]